MTDRRISEHRLPATGFISLLVLSACLPLLRGDEAPVVPAVRITLSAEDETSVLDGRILVEAQDGGVLLEMRNGRIRSLRSETIKERVPTDELFSPMTADELGHDLLEQVSDGFEIHQTDHYVVCSNSSEEYSQFCGKLLERVHDEYFRFMKEQNLVVSEPAGKLPVLIFQSVDEFQRFAVKQHPETSFDDTPGYYSLRENQMLLIDLTHDRSLRSVAEIRKVLSRQPFQVATVIHEAVHQLAFNTGLQVRMADNPVWFSEGLALYFEQTTPKTASLWTRPGLVNVRHQPAFVQRSASGVPELHFSELMSTDKPFLNADRVATAYAESWAVTTWLFRTQKDGMQKYVANLSKRKPLQTVTPERRIQEFRDAFGKSPDEIERDVVSFIRRLRVPK